MATRDGEIDSELLGTAYHEAGHCVMEIIRGRSIRYVTIIPGKRKDEHGRIALGRVVVRRPKQPLSEDQIRNELNAELMSAYAGIICEEAATGRSAQAATFLGDHEAVDKIIRAVFADRATPEIMGKMISYLFEKTHEVLRSPNVWRAVTDVANVLSVRLTLTGGEVKRIVLRALEG